ncbi:hypothetical protein Tco_1459721 [Tanacetum coccineum]
MHITRNNQPLNYKIYEYFNLKMIGFSRWFELHELASKKKGGANGQLLKNLKAKFKWVVTTAKKLNIPQLHQLTDHELPPAERKRKRTNEVSEYALTSTVQLMRTHKLIDVDSKYAQKVADELMWLIESRPDNSKARENVEKNLYAFRFDQPGEIVRYQRVIEGIDEAQLQRATSDVFKSKTPSKKSKIT